eukprot:5184975-Pleurochrysis_carterae.AAC.1
MPMARRVWFKRVGLYGRLKPRTTFERRLCESNCLRRRVASAQYISRHTLCPSIAARYATLRPPMNTTRPSPSLNRLYAPWRFHPVSPSDVKSTGGCWVDGPLPYASSIARLARRTARTTAAATRALAL